MECRIEKDTMGIVRVPVDAYYGAQTQRSIENFEIAQDINRMPKEIIYAFAYLKKGAALANKDAGVLSAEKCDLIVRVCDEILAGRLDEAFPLVVWQTGSGTQTNMNVNEVLANLALLEMGRKPGEYDVIHPLDDVNRGQSTNDVYPTALRIAAIRQLRLLSDACAKLQTAFQEKENLWQDVEKLGRTELMDAVPVTLGEEFGAYAQALARDRWRLYKVEERLRQVNIGGTAVGLSTNADRKYRFGVIEELRRLTGYGLAAAEYPMDITQNNDVFVEVSGLIKALAVNLMKIANDLRLMNSGPNGGLGEVVLPKEIGRAHV